MEAVVAVRVGEVNHHANLQMQAHVRQPVLVAYAIAQFILAGRCCTQCVAAISNNEDEGHCKTTHPPAMAVILHDGLPE